MTLLRKKKSLNFTCQRRLLFKFMIAVVTLTNINNNSILIRQRCMVICAISHISVRFLPLYLPFPSSVFNSNSYFPPFCCRLFPSDEAYRGKHFTITPCPSASLAFPLYFSFHRTSSLPNSNESCSAHVRRSRLRVSE